MVGDEGSDEVFSRIPSVVPKGIGKKAEAPKVASEDVPRIFSSGIEKRRRFGWKWIVILLILVVLAWGIWIVFFSYSTCETWDCFNEKLGNCDKVNFVGESGAMIFEYIIKGIDDGECKVSVQLLQGELNNQDSIKLEMHKMTCYLPKGVLMIPESDIGKCTGLLKEGLQDLVIKKLHTYLVQNLGQLNLEMIDLPEGL